jgi:hypothetical protein
MPLPEDVRLMSADDHIIEPAHLWVDRVPSELKDRCPRIVEHEGKTFGLKVHEFRKFVDLPTRAPGTFEIALNIHPADAGDREALERCGWKLSDPLEACSDPALFRAYIQQSGAEFSVAQGIYVDTRCGWFSDRSVRYLASGKPVLVQDTGFSRTLPVGAGLLSFRTLDDAITGAERIVRDYDAHSHAARASPKSTSTPMSCSVASSTRWE